MSTDFKFDSELIRICCTAVSGIKYVYKSEDIIDYVRHYGAKGTDSYIKKHIEKALEMHGFRKRA